MKKPLLTLGVISCGAMGALLYLAAIAFRVEPSELAATQLMDLMIGLLLGAAVLGLFHVFELPRAPLVRRKSSFVTGALVCLCAGGSLISWHRFQLAERERHSRAAAAATSTQTNVPASRPLEEVH